ncbi:hypothetical protein GO013_04150 [Pseudodesulfovibrio sp. JC047]|uniref:intermembrane phospholipid transport protein YdbH family protein n=1 Tax=Pseudodesulfovibrio sp. JC047 TaxID=2683199 RepID=UPI0013D0B0A7|nr:YdbH domain-containing protein [Pseudodesulfovibrio sp. JC047]NDV18610.1 hypothetical protein [Pseudodesulfovibrio sp. JC047]
MAAPFLKKLAKWSLLITPWLLVLVLATGWVLTSFAPRYLENEIPRVISAMGVDITEFRINHAGLFSADLGPVQIGTGPTAVTFASVHLTYTPTSLKAKRVSAIELDGISLTCSYENGRLSLPILDLLPQSESSDTTDATLPDLPFETLTIRNGTLHCSINGTPLSVPFEATLTPGKTMRTSLRIRPRDQMVNLSGELGPTLNDLALSIQTNEFHLGPFSDFFPIPIAGQVDLDLTGHMDRARPDSLTAEFTLTSRENDLSGLGIKLVETAALSLSGTMTNHTITFSMKPVSVAAPLPVTAAIQSGTISPNSLFAQFTLAGAGVEMGGRFEADKLPDNPHGLWDVALTAANPDDMTIETAGRIIHLAGFIFSLRGTAGPDTADVVLDCGTRGAGLGTTSIRTGKMRVTLPLAWPVPTRHTPGRMTLSSVRLGDRTLGNLTGTVRQQGTDLAYSGTLSTRLLPNLRIPFSGHSSMISNRNLLNFGIENYTLPTGFSPGSLVPELNEIILTGTLNADGSISMNKDGIHSRLSGNFSNGELTVQEGTTSMTGIRLSFATPDLLSMRSAPAQTLSFDTLQAGAILIRNGQIMYQLEPEGVILVEQARFNWAGGHVSSRAFRVVPKSDAYDVTMFCSELKLSEILSQLGLAEAQGEAAMSGELPITWRDGKLSFNSGFLHSTPGQGGTIRVRAMDNLVAAIPEGTPQRGHIELAQAAVRDFEYKWVRIKADTVGEDLLVRLSVDGKPAGTLPFVYKREFGGFMRVTGDVKGSNFQGLRLDVNFSVPLDRILLYKDIMNVLE